MVHGRSRLAGVFTLIVAGCGSDGSSGASPQSPATPVDGGTVGFEDAATLTLLPGAEIDVAARVTPADGRAVRFALLDEPADSSLSASEVPTDGDGVARTRLRAASRAVTFRVRATSGAASALRTVSVGGAGFASIRVTPKYAGKRAVAAWTATVSTSGRCSDQSAPVRPDGPLLAGAGLRIDGVPVGARVIVGVRGGHAVGGCAELDDLSLGEVRELSVAVQDAPLVVAPLRASVRFEASKGPPSSVAGVWRESFWKSLLGGAKTPWSALLDAMATSLPAAKAPAFLAARKAGAWDALAEAQAPDAASGLGAWLDAGATRLQLGLTLEGELKSDAPDGTATFTPRFALGASLDPASSPPRVASWASLPDDVARLSSELSLPPARLLAAAVEAEAGLAGDATLSTALGCDPVSKLLAAKAAIGCDVTCLRAACEGATKTMWLRAARSDEVAGKLAKVTATATLDASVDAEARLTSGAGVGSLSLSTGGAEWQADAVVSLSVEPAP